MPGRPINLPHDAPTPEKGMGCDAASHDAVGETVRSFMDAVMATGMDLPQAIGHVAATFGTATARSLFLEATWMDLPPRTLGGHILDVLDGVGSVVPDVANAWLNEDLASGRLDAWAGFWRENLWGMGVHLVDAGWIRTLPGSLQLSHNIHISNCPHLAVLPDMEVPVLTLNHCVGLERIGPLRARQVNIEHCPRLRELSDGMDVQELTLEGLAGLEHLPEGLRIAVLEIRNCVTWDGRIPQDASIRSAVITPGHPMGIPLAAWREQHPHGEREGGTS